MMHDPSKLFPPTCTCGANEDYVYAQYVQKTRMENNGFSVTLVQYGGTEYVPRFLMTMNGKINTTIENFKNCM